VRGIIRHVHVLLKAVIWKYCSGQEQMGVSGTAGHESYVLLQVATCMCSSGHEPAAASGTG
jgi:hypothetical protein